MITNFKSAVKNLHNDESGLESLQVVMIIAIAAMIMLAAATVGNQGVEWMKTQVGKLIGQDLSSFAGAEATVD